MGTQALRADAAHNRERILAVARELLAERGAAEPRDEIAPRGAGIATRRASAVSRPTSTASIPCSTRLAKLSAVASSPSAHCRGVYRLTTLLPRS